ncbi:hypothetical protein BU15DRAFT_68454 [Melanogaster broomeanus]|nr:hypothetical protein BU15DRAFT_68454 [Melanogaster broomeanus]
MWYDHDLKWCLRVVGSQELDFRFAILQPVVGQRHFKTGVSKLKQVMGQAQRDMQKYIVALIAGADGPSPAFIRAIRALMDFWYLSQAPVLTDTICQKISELLQEFHDNKHAIISSGGHCGKKNNVLDNWYIPKLELMQSVVLSISNVGSLLQWSADTTEHAHITLIKDPGEATNNHNYDPQICRFLDRAEKCRLFDDAVRLVPYCQCEPYQGPLGGQRGRQQHNDNDNDNDNNGSVELPEIHPASHGSWTPSHTHQCSVAIHLNYDPSIRRISVDGAAEQFSLPDLRGTLVDYFYNDGTTGHFHTLSQQRRAPADARLPFEDMQLWYKVRIQQKHWPRSGLNGHILAEVRLVMRPIPPRGTHPAWRDQCLVYIQRLDVQAQAGSAVVEPITQMHILKRGLVRQFGRSADSRLNCFNSSHFSDLFYLNKYFDKDFYYALYEASRLTDMEFPQNGFRVVLVMLDRANSQVHLATLLMASKRKQLEEEDGGRGGVEIQPPLRCSGRHGAGSGGRAAQLSSIGRALESPKKAKKRGKIEVPASEPLNALAPGPKPKTRGNGATTRSRAKQKGVKLCC